MNINDLDLGWRPAHLLVSAGQAVARAQVFGAQSQSYTTGQSPTAQDVRGWVEAWQTIGGQNAQSLAALRLLRQQVRELADNPDMQPVLLQPAATAQPGFSSRADQNDGWYWISAFGYDPETYNQYGAQEVDLSFIRICALLPASLKMLYEGSALGSTYSAGTAVLIALPLGATGAGTALSRVGGEGTIPLVVPPSAGPNPVPIVASATLANLWKGGVRCYDTVTAGANAVDTTGIGANAFAHQTWVQIYGPDHDLTGDLVLTNGLLLFRFNQGGTIDFYAWNTSLGTAAWQQVGTIAYRDSGLLTGSVRSIDLERVSLRSSRAVVQVSTSAANFAQLAFDLDAGHLAAAIDWKLLTEANTRGLGLELVLTTAIKAVANEAAAVDVATQGTTSLAPTAAAGWALGIGTTANQLLAGLLWQNPPNSGQPLAQSTTEMGAGETTGPAQGSFRTYGVFAVPYVTAPNLLAEAESGTLGTGWSSVTTSGESGNASAKCTSGTLTGNADTWGTAFVPAAGVYDAWVRIKLTSLASATVQMQIGAWNSTDSVFFSSVTWAPTNAALVGGTAYIWVRVAAAFTPTAGKSLRFRAVTTATTTTDWFIDQSALVPVRATATPGQGSFPADIWAQFMGRRRIRLVPGR